MYGELKSPRVCIALVGAEKILTRAGPKRSPLLGRRYGIDNEKMQNFVHDVTIALVQTRYQGDWGAPITMVPCLH